MEVCGKTLSKYSRSENSVEMEFSDGSKIELLSSSYITLIYESLADRINKDVVCKYKGQLVVVVSKFRDDVTVRPTLGGRPFEVHITELRPVI